MSMPTLLDVAKRTDPSGKIAAIAELLSQTNEILRDAVFKEGNLPTGHQVTIRTGLPDVYYRSLNEGITPSKSETAQVTETCSIIEARSEVDIDVAKLNGNVQAFRMSEARAFIEAMNQKMATGLFYGNPAADAKEFLGLTARYSGLSDPNSSNIISCGGGDADQQTSAWLVVWGDNTIFCAYPKGSSAGLLHEDLGRQTSFDVTNVAGAHQATKRMEVFADRFQWKNGLVVKDWRYAVRLCNIGTTDDDTNSISDLGGSMAATTTTNLLHKMTQAHSKIPNLRMGRPVWYVNRTVFTGLMRLALEKSSSVLAIQPALTQFGTHENMMSFLGVPIRCVDALLVTEAVVS